MAAKQRIINNLIFKKMAVPGAVMLAFLTLDTFLIGFPALYGQENMQIEGAIFGFSIQAEKT